MASGNLGLPQTFNRYAYVRNNSLNLVDPTGMITEGIGHGNSDYAAEMFSKKKEFEHREMPWVIRQDPTKPQQKPPTVLARQMKGVAGRF